MMGKEVELWEMMGVWRKLQLRLFGRVNTGITITRPGWRGSLPLYAFRCPTHGVVQDYPHGHSQRLECPRCREEKSHE